MPLELCLLNIELCLLNIRFRSSVGTSRADVALACARLAGGRVANSAMTPLSYLIHVTRRPRIARSSVLGVPLQSAAAAHRIPDSLLLLPVSKKVFSLD